MGRTNQKKINWEAVVVIDDNIIHQSRYISLTDIANDLNLSYNQVAAISVGRSKRFESEFKYQPKIQINKIESI
tara:strand:+ start:29 stop:250 length:222 start_codon:yes stop_codon:yes gene_type:complete